MSRKKESKRISKEDLDRVIDKFEELEWMFKDLIERMRVYK